MIAIVNIVYPEPRGRERHEISVRSKSVTPRFLGTVGTSVQAKFKDDPDWLSWELVDVKS